ncbi:MAG TPA: NDP-sugar synthase [Candidatus Saccharibacteria bacterium]|nr:NDP-sugar synthase [Candidatus Saccharibacteria bacterium]HMR38143.1 NDP-sugar synthase [Candidatus Saccharibacteria bacterium]
MTLQSELDILGSKIASFHEPEDLADEEWQNFVENTTVALMAGGESSRFSSVLEGTQANKSAFELPNGDTMIEMIIRMYAQAGFKRFVALVFHNARSIEERLGDGSEFGVEIVYSYDPEIPIGKGGAVLNALENGSIPESHNLIVANPDDVVLHFPDFPKYISSAHIEGLKRGAVATAVLGQGQAYHSTGMMVVDNKVVDTKMYPFIPVPAHVGITLFSPEAYPYFREHFSLTEKSDFENILFPILANEGKLWSAGLTRGVWIAVNDAKSYKQLVGELGL